MAAGYEFDSALYGVSPDIAQILQRVPYTVKQKTREIRLRKGQPLILTVGECPTFLQRSGGISNIADKNSVYVDENQVEQSFRLICRGSVYSHENEIKNGFVRMRYGHRAGICGRVTAANISDISSINIRIARQIKNAACGIVPHLLNGGVLIAGPPSSGKTTVLRDLIRRLSSGEDGTFHRIAVVDTRGEISASDWQNKGYDLGVSSDILLSCEKAEGLQIAIRTLSPHYVAFDEIGTLEEVEGVRAGLYSGVNVITTAHIGEMGELYKREVTRELLKSGAISNIICLSKVGEPIRIYTYTQIERLLNA